ncbi:MAG: tRNA(Arg) A34 adenosine deaminase TadA [Rickettsiales bacterium]|jgi:tRNA(Arg) A34 adenosine deaminase TadA
MNKPNPFILEALNQARMAFDLNEVPVGAVVVRNNKIIAAAYNQNIALNDPTAHAEILALRKACALLESHRLESCDLYVTLEPCAMCAGAISHAKIRRLYYGASDEKSGGVENGARVFSHKQCHHKPEIYSGISALESEKLLKDFFAKRRK